MWPSLDDKDKRFNRIIMYAKNPNHSEPLRLAFYVPKKFDKKFNSKLPAIVHLYDFFVLFLFYYIIFFITSVF